ncbi:hypothetical protein [Novosphingobium rosa]|uniref:hypothetical protein n=1 Tax=Novosphingobium rosa TaxID=76978 RepID=UPI000829DA88|nr:hypothetical protein [Novosphingobium rosa]
MTLPAHEIYQNANDPLQFRVVVAEADIHEDAELNAAYAKLYETFIDEVTDNMLPVTHLVGHIDELAGLVSDHLAHAFQNDPKFKLITDEAAWPESIWDLDVAEDGDEFWVFDIALPDNAQGKKAATDFKAAHQVETTGW